MRINRIPVAVLMILLLWTSTAHADWKSVNDMKIARSHHAATLLKDGRVLVTGGKSGRYNILDSAELYDPSTGSWSSARNLSVRRTYHSATLLLDGRVLVAGGRVSESGDVNTNNTNSVEIYDPSTGRWYSTGALIHSRSWHSAAMLADGKVLVTGGLSNYGYYHNSTELYDPITGTWSIAGYLDSGRSGPITTLLGNGDLVMAGGWVTPVEKNRNSELFDLTSDDWRATGALKSSRGLTAATLLRDGRVLITGGARPVVLDEGPPPTVKLESINSVEIYSSSSGTWKVTGSLNKARSRHTATLLKDGGVLVTGGFGINGPMKSAEIYAPSTGMWKITESMSSERAYHSSTILKDARC